MLYIIIFIILLLLYFDKRMESFNVDRKRVGIIIIATNGYFLLGLRFLKQWLYYNNRDVDYKFYFFTDRPIYDYLPNGINNVVLIPTNHDNWINAVESKFRNIYNLSNRLMKECDYVYYFDADTSINRKFYSDWFLLGDIVGGEHFNNIEIVKPYDRNVKSAAYIPINTPYQQIYYYGAFFGGRTKNVLDMCGILIDYQFRDRMIGYEPIWNDESYLNRYFHYNPPKLVKNGDFQFRVSDKDGLKGNSRDPKNKWQDKYLIELLKYRDNLFDFDKDGLKIMDKL